MNLLVNSRIEDPMTPAYMRQLILSDYGKPSGGDLACVLDVTQTVIRPEWDRVVVGVEVEED